MQHVKALLIALTIASPALARECPPVPDNNAEKDRLHAELLATKTEMSARAVGSRLWRNLVDSAG